jgi:hypothetical protein
MRQHSTEGTSTMLSITHIRKSSFIRAFQVRIQGRSALAATSSGSSRRRSATSGRPRRSIRRRSSRLQTIGSSWSSAGYGVCDRGSSSTSNSPASIRSETASLSESMVFATRPRPSKPSAYRNKTLMPTLLESERSERREAPACAAPLREDQQRCKSTPRPLIVP